jgi:ABC-2 type transport system ATP-binding protein
MRAKVALALGMAHEPELLILDEPTSGLDPLVRREFLESMVDVAAAGRTVFLSSHQIGEVERVADIVAILKNGKLLAVERLDDLKSQTRELTLTLTNGAPYLSDVPGQVISRREHDRQWRLLVRHLDENRLESFRSLAQVRDVEVRTLNLEEIFVGYMQAGDEPPKGTAR